MPPPRILAAVTAVVLVANVAVLGAREWQEARRPPTFGQGGERFGRAALPTIPAPPGAAVTPRPTVSSTPPAAEPTGGEPPDGAAAPAGPAPTQAPTTAAASEPVPAQPAAPGAQPAAPPGDQPQPHSTSAPPAATLQHPRLGEYEYALDGWEQTTAPGSRRRFPDSATVVVHSPAQTVSGTDFTFDVTYLQDQHEERLVVRYSDRGLEVTFEGGKVVFFGGAVTQTSQGVYHPPVLRTPYPAAGGHTWSGTAEVRAPDSGEVVRQERFQGRVLGEETLMVAGQQVRTVAVTWESQFSGKESGWRQQRLWLSPELGVWVKAYERLHGERANFSYDRESTLTLRRLPG